MAKPGTTPASGKSSGGSPKPAAGKGAPAGKPSTTGLPSGKGRDNNPPSKGK